MRRRLAQIGIALIVGIAIQGLIFLLAKFWPSFAEYLMFPVGYALWPIFPEGLHSGHGEVPFVLYLIVANVLCYSLVSYILILLVSVPSATRHD